ncbi:uncharacterized protein KRP23_2624 [Phytophthora ramorum]|uniref:uncharacterized protein n=1 Tax=Phytophthora ramorum TaxID=164328 RepID=UPI0030B6571D|nr:hypothetical protein KRP23_2624 [Phytophthora ramorum]
MEWNNLRPYHSNQSTFTQQPHGPAQPWYYDEEEDEGVPEFRRSSTTLQADRYAGRSGLAPPPVIPSLKVESASSGGGSAALQSLSSLSMPQLEESTEFQSFFSPPGGRFADSTYLSENQPPQLQQQEQQGEQLPSQFSGQFTPFPSAMATYYPPLTPAPTPMLSAARPSMDYYSEGIATLPSTHCPVPTLPSTFGSLQRQQQLSQTILEDRCENFDNSNVCDTPLPTAPTDTTISLQIPPALSMGTYAEHPSLSTSTPPDYPTTPAFAARDKRGRELGAPFTEMATTVEPKFSPDKRKLCCVEGSGCEKKAHLKRLCRKHGGGAKCCITGCTKWAQRQGMCMTHSKMVGTQASGIGPIGDSFLTERNPSPPPSAPDSSSPSLQFFSDNVPV